MAKKESFCTVCEHHGKFPTKQKPVKGSTLIAFLAFFILSFPVPLLFFITIPWMIIGILGIILGSVGNRKPYCPKCGADNEAIIPLDSPKAQKAMNN